MTHHVGVRLSFTNHQTSIRLQNTKQLSEYALSLGNLSESGNQIGCIEGAIRVRKLPRISLRRDHIIQSEFMSLTDGMVKHPLLDVQNLQASTRRDPPGGV